MDQPGNKAVNPARGQLKRENECFPVPVCAWEFGHARRVWPSRPASACPFFTLRLNLGLTHVIPPAFQGGVIYLYRRPTSGQSRVNCVTQEVRTDGVHCPDFAGTGPVAIMMVVPVTDSLRFQVSPSHHGPTKNNVIR